MEDIDFYLSHAQETMDKTVSHTQHELSRIRAGKANPSMLEGLEVEYYGNMTPLNQVASITTPDARSIVIKPWEKSMVQEIERSIINSDTGFNPQNDGELIRINIPPLTEERRKALVKQVRNLFNLTLDFSRLFKELLDTSSHRARVVVDFKSGWSFKSFSVEVGGVAVAFFAFGYF